MKLLGTYKTHAPCLLANGKAVSFLMDPLQGQSLQSVWPQLFYFAKSQHFSMHQVHTLEDVASLFHLPLLVEAFSQFQQFEVLLDGIALGDDPDSWQFPANTLHFKVDQAYKLLSRDSTPILAISWLWKTCNQLKHKNFYWLRRNDRLNTRQLLQRKIFFIYDYTCVMCDQFVVESRDPLLFHYQFAQIYFRNICPTWSILLYKIKLAISDIY